MRSKQLSVIKLVNNNNNKKKNLKTSGFWVCCFCFTVITIIVLLSLQYIIMIMPAFVLVERQGVAIFH